MKVPRKDHTDAATFISVAELMVSAAVDATLDECASIVRLQTMMPFTNRSAISALNVVADKIEALKLKGS